MLIRKAGIQDIPQISQLINSCAEYGLMLHRSLSFLYEHVRDFHVAAENDRVAGVCGLSIVWADLAEIYALAVHPDYRGRGLGKRLVLACISEAEQLGIRRLMVLTYVQKFFERCGFHVVDRQQLPLKVWSECVRCPKNQACDEIAMMRVLEHVPDPGQAPPPPPAPGTYEVPVVLNIPSLSSTQNSAGS